MYVLQNHITERLIIKHMIIYTMIKYKASLFLMREGRGVSGCVCVFSEMKMFLHTSLMIMIYVMLPVDLLQSLLNQDKRVLFTQQFIAHTVSTFPRFLRVT
jgi:hypothetical protein